VRLKTSIRAELVEAQMGWAVEFAGRAPPFDQQAERKSGFKKSGRKTPALARLSGHFHARERASAGVFAFR